MEILKSGRKNPDVSKRTRRAQMKEAREKLAREQAEERQAAFGALSIMDKIAILDRRLGPNVGATKQRVRLKAQLEAQAETAEKRQAEAKSKQEKKQNAQQQASERKHTGKGKKNKS